MDWYQGEKCPTFSVQTHWSRKAGGRIHVKQKLLFILKMKCQIKLDKYLILINIKPNFFLFKGRKRSCISTENIWTHTHTYTLLHEYNSCITRIWYHFVVYVNSFFLSFIGQSINQSIKLNPQILESSGKDIKLNYLWRCSVAGHAMQTLRRRRSLTLLNIYVKQ